MTPGAPRIRPATVEDARAITELHVAAWQTAYRGIVPDAYLDALDVDERTVARRAHLGNPMNPAVRNWVLEGATGLLGWAATGPARDDDLGPGIHELMAIYLWPYAVGQGHGRALMEHCVADAVARGYEAMTIWVLSGNERAQRFYRAAGFEPDPRLAPEPFRDTGATKLRMVRPLPSAGTDPASPGSSDAPWSST